MSDNKAQTASERVKSKGFKNLKEVSALGGESTQTLNNWFNHAPRRFDLHIKGLLLDRLIQQAD